MYPSQNTMYLENHVVSLRQSSDFLPMYVTVVACCLQFIAHSEWSVLGFRYCCHIDMLDSVLATCIQHVI